MTRDPDAGSGRDSEIPPELRDLDQLLGAIRFEPRASLEAEVLGRIRRGDRIPTQRHLLQRGPMALAILTVAFLTVSLVAGWSWFERRRDGPFVDRCCFDLDGGGKQDDGVLVSVTRRGEVSHFTIYEDGLGARRFRSGDPVLFAPGREIRLAAPAMADWRTLHQCCFDLDGGGVADDGVLTFVQSPGQIALATIYETGVRDSLVVWGAIPSLRPPTAH